LAKNNRMRYAVSRRRQRLIWGGLVVAVAVVIWFDRSRIEPGRRLPAGDFARYHDKSFTVVNVVDGDTLDINSPDGDFGQTRIRLWGIDTPERGAFFGDEATEFATELALGTRVKVFLDEGNRTRGKYGRLLAYVQLPDKTFMNEVLLVNGFAYADLRFRHSLYHKYIQLEASARGLEKGLWAQVSREQLPEWLQRSKPTLLEDK